MITTAGNGPAPSGLDSSTGTCSEVPLGVVVVIEDPESVGAQPAATRQPASAIPTAERRAVMATDCTSRPLSAARAPQRDLKYCTARSCASAARRVLNVPRLRRLPVFGSTLREYS